MKPFKILPVISLILLATSVFANNKQECFSMGMAGAGSNETTISVILLQPETRTNKEVNFTYLIPFPKTLMKTTVPSPHKTVRFDDDILPVHVGKLVPAFR
ncbi:MAG TPA: hypothetical protein PKJ28_05100 [Bacteroidales bacterium]|nr:hypothetical protein [Bacteroidales bacterium]HPS73524.1 hypothetical protein [Bacteroidales bacterium]